MQSGVLDTDAATSSSALQPPLGLSLCFKNSEALKEHMSLRVMQLRKRKRAAQDHPEANNGSEAQIPNLEVALFTSWHRDWVQICLQPPKLTFSPLTISERSLQPGIQLSGWHRAISANGSSIPKVKCQKSNAR